MHLWRFLLGGSVALLACSSRSAGTGGSESNDESTESAAESSESSPETESETGDPGQPCSTEWDCGVGERCVEGTCACVGCACQSPNTIPGTLAAPVDDDEVPVFLDIVPPECQVDADCGPLAFCSSGQCYETTACVEDLDCRADWWPEQERFCIDGLCNWLGCDYELEGDAGCPEGSICYWGCKWFEVVPSCAGVPSFDEGVAHTLDMPDTATVVVLDVDLDGRDDIVVLENGFIYWLTSTGVGFEPPTPWAVEPGTQIVALGRADIHGDGVDELLVSHAEPIGVEFLAVGPSWPQHAGFAATTDVPDDASTIDVDYDGLPDLVTATRLAGSMTLIESHLGDGTGTFGPLWNETIDQSFDFSQPASDHPDQCVRTWGAVAPTYLAVQRMNPEGLEYSSALVNRDVAGHMLYPATSRRSAGFVATVGLVGSVDRGLLFHDQLSFLEIEPSPGAVALVARDANKQHAFIDRGVEAAEFVELAGDPLVPQCRGSLGVALDSAALDVGDFDGDGREDLLGHGSDGVLRVWYSRD